MTPELQLFQSLLEALKEQRKDIAKLQTACVALRNVLTEIDPKLENRYKELFAQASAVPKPPAQEQIDALIEQILQITKTGNDPVH
jgi:septal ring factor EnvC (AmiA/AmiB activator)